MLEKTHICSPPLQSHISPFFIIKEFDDIFEKEVSIKTAVLYCPGLFSIEDMLILCSRSDLVKMWPGHFCATITNRTPTHPAILRTYPGSNALWQDDLIAIGTAPFPCKPLLPLGQQRCP